MRFFTSAPWAWSAVILLAACSSYNGAPPNSSIQDASISQGQVPSMRTSKLIPDWLHVASPVGIHKTSAPAGAKRGIYVSSYDGTAVYGFPYNNKEGKPATCEINTGTANINAIAVDRKGNLVLPFGSPNVIYIYSGPGMCGSEVGSIVDNYGEPSSASSADATTGVIAVGMLHLDSVEPGGVVLCTLSGGCGQPLSSSTIAGPGGGVLMSDKGDCWLTSMNPSFTSAELTYWKGCTGSGQVAKGFRNDYYGSITFDAEGNIDSLDFGGSGSGKLWVYRGCNPKCKVVGGPYALESNAIFGSTNKRGDTYGATGISTGDVDIYHYSPTGGLKYEYSFSTGFSQSAGPEGFAYNPVTR